MADVIVVDEEDVPRPPSSTLASSSSSRRLQLTTPTHVTQSPFASASKNKHVLQAENHKLFSEVVAQLLCKHFFRHTGTILMRPDVFV